MDLPRTLIISTKKGKAREIAENIGAVYLSEQDDNVDYLWNIDNKYYTSQILVRTIENISIILPVEEVYALVVFYDPDADKVDQELQQLASLVAPLNTVEVLLLSSNAISETILRDKVLNWCIHNHFELVEFDKTKDSEIDAEFNKYGINRIIEALHANSWPNIVFKEKPHEEKASEVNEIEERFENMRLTCDVSERLCIENMLDSIMGDQNADFGELYGQLMAMKEHTASLPTNERRIVAEQVVTAFWKAMGGDLLDNED